MSDAVRLAPSEVSDELTGYTHNSVTPFGMQTDIPVRLHTLRVYLLLRFFSIVGLTVYSMHSPD